jgi:hypothetical protein
MTSPLHGEGRAFESPRAHLFFFDSGARIVSDDEDDKEEKLPTSEELPTSADGVTSRGIIVYCWSATVFVRDTDGAVWQKSYNHTWAAWHSLGGQLAPNTGPGVLGGVFVQGTDRQLWWQQFGEAGSAWSRLPACPEVLSASSPAVIFNSNGHTQVFVSTTSGNLMGCTAWDTG